MLLGHDAVMIEGETPRDPDEATCTSIVRDRLESLRLKLLEQYPRFWGVALPRE
jgi:hypothetical protein